MARDWLVNGYFRLTQRAKTILNDEALQLGLMSAVSLLQLQARQFKSRTKSNNGTRTLPVTVKSVRKPFHDELQRMDHYDSDSEIQDITTILVSD